MTRRVVITGMGGATAFGENWQDIPARLPVYENATRKTPEWQVYDRLRTLSGVPVDDFTLPGHYTRKHIRTTGRASQVSTRASELALKQAGSIGDPILASGEMGIAYGSLVGNTGPVNEFVTMLTEKHTNNITGTTYVQMMPHTTAVNAGLFFGLRGRMIPASSACTSSSQAISYAREAVRRGYQTIMVAGGAEKLCPSEAAIFDALFTTSQHSDVPKVTPSPFDENRGEPVTGEGAGTLTLEELEYAKAHGAAIYGKVVGFVTDYDAAHITRPQRETMQYCMEQSLKIAGLSAQDIGYIPTHGTTTDHGDMAEGLAAATIYGGNVPLSLLKSYFGHTLGACGAFEAWISLQTMCEGRSVPTLSLNEPNLDCDALDYIMHEARKVNCEFLQDNNFTFGGISTPITVKRWP